MAYSYTQNYSNNQIVRKPQNAVADIKNIANSPAMKNRFKEVLGEKAPAFISGVLAAVNTNSALQKAEPNSVLASAMVAATLNLSCVPSLGQAALVPYDIRSKTDDGRWESHKLVQFQIMTRGLVQLSQRTGQYKIINTGMVYEDEYDDEDLLTGEVRFHRVHGGYRDQGMDDKVVGYFAYIETVTGFKHTEYWTKEDVLNHAQRFSKSFEKGPWHDHFDRMAEKTVLKSCLNHYGPMSVDSVIADAIAKDQQIFDSNGNATYADNLQNVSEEDEKTAVDEPNSEIQESVPENADEKPQAVSDASYEEKEPEAEGEIEEI